MNAVEALRSIRPQPGTKPALKGGFEMCEHNAYLIRDGEEELVMESVDIIIPEEEGVYLQNIFGEQLLVKARIKQMNLVDHHILLE